MLSYARSGGTLLNQCLASMVNTVVISEVNPNGGGWGKEMENSVDTIWGQAKEWYDIELCEREYYSALIELERYCEEKGLHLVVRDWVYASFAEIKYNNYSPIKKLEVYHKLSKMTRVIPFAFIRDSVDVWISLGMEKTNKFYSHYKPYLYEIIANNIIFFKYEDFCMNPLEEMQKICKYLGIMYNSNFVYEYFENKANGNTQYTYASEARLISPKERKIISRSKIREINTSSEMKYCNKILSYSTNYYDGFSGWFRIESNKAGNLLNYYLQKIHRIV